MKTASVYVNSSRIPSELLVYVIAAASILLFLSQSIASDVATGCSAKYISRLERKQESLSCIREDISKIRQSVEAKVKLQEGIDIAKENIAPCTDADAEPTKEVSSTSIMELAPVPFQAPVRPETSLDKVKERIETKYTEKK